MKKFLNSKLLNVVALSFCTVALPMSGYAKHHPRATKASELRSTLATVTKQQEFAYIAKKASDLQLPKSLALIPVIESHYNPGVVSNKGAGGLWQLMPATAKQYGITSQQRFQLQPSTTAALHYFSALHRQFGNWEFAVAAYNAGGGRVMHALRKHPGATSVSQLNLPLETKQYVQKFDRMQQQLRSYAA
jgi:membrane-bound lytic murein transglycosylase MltF